MLKLKCLTEFLIKNSNKYNTGCLKYLPKPKDNWLGIMSY